MMHSTSLCSAVVAHSDR